MCSTLAALAGLANADDHDHDHDEGDDHNDDDDDDGDDDDESEGLIYLCSTLAASLLESPQVSSPAWTCQR